MELLLKNCLINNQKTNILIKNGKIVNIGTNLQEVSQSIDCKEYTLIPGIIDPHVHVRDLNQSYKEDWHTASLAALAGGTTTIFDMPNTNPPTTNLQNLDLKRDAALKASVNYGFYLGATHNNEAQIREILDTNPSDVVGIKLFMAASSSNEIVEELDDLKKFFVISKQYNIPLAIHAEMHRCIEEWQQTVNQDDIHFHNQIRNRSCAIKATEIILEMAKIIGNPLYVVHTSTAEEIAMVREAKRTANVFCEIAPHHLLLNETIINKAGNFAKVNPPIRTQRDNDALLQAINDGVVDTIGTDHAPHGLSEKLKSYNQAPSGFPGLETSLPLLLNEVNERKFSLTKLIEITSTNAAKIFQLTSKGKIEIGFDADLTIIDINKEQLVDSQNFNSKAKYSPFDGFRLKGAVLMTFVNGKLMYKNENI